MGLKRVKRWLILLVYAGLMHVREHIDLVFIRVPLICAKPTIGTHILFLPFLAESCFGGFQLGHAIFLLVWTELGWSNGSSFIGYAYAALFKLLLIFAGDVRQFSLRGFSCVDIAAANSIYIWHAFSQIDVIDLEVFHFSATGHKWHQSLNCLLVLEMQFVIFGQLT